MRQRTIFSSVLLIGVMTAALVGGSYAIFTDQVQSDLEEFSAGTVDIEVNEQDIEFETTFHVGGEGGWAPGDQTSQGIVIRNDGTLDVIYTVYLDYGYDPGDIFRCDPNGYSMRVWAENDVGVIPAGTNVDVDLHALLPLAAGNDCQDKDGTLIVTVHAVQQRNIDGVFECVKLVYKDGTSDWRPYGPSDTLGGFWQGQHGNVCYREDDGHLRVVVNAYGLTPDAYYQLALNGQGGCSVPESVTFAGMPGDLYHSGWSSGSTTALSSTCSNTWDEGVFNFDGTDGELQASDDGNFSADVTLDLSSALPAGTYNDVKFIVKEITGYSGAPAHPDTAHGNNWQPMLMEIRTLDFDIP